MATGPIKINGRLVKRRKGVAQGSPLSPLLSNIMLHELDAEYEKQGLRYVRYSDDFSVYTKSKFTARKVGNSIYLFLKNKLNLSINREKSGIRKPVLFSLLDYKFVPTYEKGAKGKYQLVVTDKSWNNLKRSLKSITKKTAPSTFDERIAKLKEVQRGWLNYFRVGNIQGKLNGLDSWLRNRLRYCIWEDWKKLERKRKNIVGGSCDYRHVPLISLILLDVNVTVPDCLSTKKSKSLTSIMSQSPKSPYMTLTDFRLYLTLSK